MRYCLKCTEFTSAANKNWNKSKPSYTDEILFLFFYTISGTLECVFQSTVKNPLTFYRGKKKDIYDVKQKKICTLHKMGIFCLNYSRMYVKITSIIKSVPFCLNNSVVENVRFVFVFNMIMLGKHTMSHFHTKDICNALWKGSRIPLIV